MSAHLLEVRPPTQSQIFHLITLEIQIQWQTKERVTMRHGASADEGAQRFGSAQSQQSN